MRAGHDRIEVQEADRVSGIGKVKFTEGGIAMKWKKGKNRLDEMQEQKMLQIEHNGCWLAFWGLGIVLIVQRSLGMDLKAAAGEGIVFMCLALYIVTACVRNGIWDRKLSPTPKVNLGASLIAGIIGGGIYFYNTYAEYHAFWGSVAAGLFIMGLTAVVCFGALSVACLLYRKRREQLESEDEE